MSLTIREALDSVFAKIKSMSKEDLRSELNKHKDGEFVIALKETSEFLNDSYGHSNEPELPVKNPYMSGTELYNEWNRIQYLFECA